MEDTYENAYTEVLEIIKYMPKEEREKIPQSEIEYFEKNRNKSYRYIYIFPESKHLRKTDIVLISLYRQYIANSKEKNKINELLWINEKNSNTKWKNQQIFNVEKSSKDNDCKALVNNNEKLSVIRKILARVKKFFVRYTKGKK